MKRPIQILDVFLRLCIPLLMVMLGINAHAQGPKLKGLPFIKNFTANDYNGGIQNWDITQDKNGIIYIANNLGLLEYDGSSWNKYSFQGSSKFRSVYIHDSGRIYIGVQGDFGYFYPNDSGQLEYTSLADSLKIENRNFDETWKVYEQNESIYFCTFKNVYEYDGSKLKTYSSDYNLEISFQVNNKLYVQQWELGLTILKNGQFELIQSGEFFKDKRISSIIPFQKNKLLIATFNHGLFVFNDGNITSYPLDPSVSWSSIQINSILRLRSGRIALGTQNAGIFIIENSGRINYHLDRSSGLQDQTINSIYEDYNGNLWLGMNFGVCRIELSSPFSIIDQRLGISGTGYTALMHDSIVYLGTNNGLYRIHHNYFNNLLLHEHQKLVKGSEGQVYSLSEQNGQLVMGHHKGAFIVENDRVREISNEKGAWLFKQLPGQSEYYLQGSYLGVNLFKKTPGGLKWQHKIEGFGESSRIIEFGLDDEIWITHGYKGAYKLKLNRGLTHFTEVKHYGQSSGFPSDNLINAFNINNELIFSSERGFFSYQPAGDKFVTNNSYNDLIGSQSSIIDMKEDDMGNVYFMEQSEIGKLTPTSQNGLETNSKSFNKLKGLLNDDLGNINIIDFQSVLFGASEGFIHFDASYPFDINKAFKLLFREIRSPKAEGPHYFYGRFIENGEVKGDQPSTAIPVIPYQENSISFAFSAIHFESGDNIRYQYKLENLDDEWSDWTLSNTKEYTSLPEGKYSFQVKAQNIYQQESDIISYEFVVKPPLHRTNLAYSIYSITGIALLFFGFRILDKKYKRERSELAQKQEQQLSKKETEIKTITEQSEKEIMKLKNDKLHSEIQHMNNELTSSAMHLIQKNQLLNNIKNTIQTLTKSGDEKNHNQALKKIVKSITADLSNNEEWKVFEKNFDKVHGNFITRLKKAFPKLSPQELKLCAYLRMNLNTKEIAHLLNISVRGVEIGRYRLRKKLGLERQDNLTDFILRF